MAIFAVYVLKIEVNVFGADTVKQLEESLAAIASTTANNSSTHLPAVSTQVPLTDNGKENVAPLLDPESAENIEPLSPPKPTDNREQQTRSPSVAASARRVSLKSSSAVQSMASVTPTLPQKSSIPTPSVRHTPLSSATAPKFTSATSIDYSTFLEKSNFMISEILDREHEPNPFAVLPPLEYNFTSSKRPREDSIDDSEEEEEDERVIKKRAISVSSSVDQEQHPAVSVFDSPFTERVMEPVTPLIHERPPWRQEGELYDIDQYTPRR